MKLIKVNFIVQILTTLTNSEDLLQRRNLQFCHIFPHQISSPHPAKKISSYGIIKFNNVVSQFIMIALKIVIKQRAKRSQGCFNHFPVLDSHTSFKKPLADCRQDRGGQKGQTLETSFGVALFKRWNLT